MNQSLHDLFESLPEPEPEYEPVTEKTPRVRDKRPPNFIPWIIVALVVIAAVSISIVLVNNARAGDSVANEPAVTPTETSPDASVDPVPSTEPEDDAEPEEAEDEGVPEVAVGDTFTMPIDVWGVSAEVSGKFGSVTYSIAGDDLILSSALINSLPDECAEMRTQWGATKTADGFEVLKPAQTCEAAPEVYDEIWGLIDAMVASIK